SRRRRRGSGSRNERESAMSNIVGQGFQRVGGGSRGCHRQGALRYTGAMSVHTWLSGFVLLAGVVSTGAAGGPPRVVEAVPDHADAGVDPGLKELRITFDQDMQQGGFSLCGGGPTFPKITERPRWEGARTLVVPVSLEAGKRYELSVNCPSARNFRSAP